MELFLAHILLILVLLCFSAFFSGSEAALFSLSKAQVRRLRDSSATGGMVAGMLQHPRKLLITILLGNLLVNILSTSLVTSVSIQIFGERGVGYAFIAMSIVLITVGEIFPKVVALHRAELFSKAVIVPLRIFHIVFSPLWYVLSRFTDFAVGRIRRYLGQHRKVYSPAELRTAVEIGLQEGDLEEYEHAILSNILSFRDKVVREIMTPSIEVFSLPLQSSRDELMDNIRKSTFSRIPLFGESTDDIRGILHVKDLTRIMNDTAGGTIEDFLRSPYYIPESARIAELFNEFLDRTIHIAIVIDEYGSFVGIVTLEDILEEIFGDIRDATDPVTAEYRLLDQNRIIVAGTMEIDNFNQVFGTRLPEGVFETVAGFVIGETGYIPNEGETISAAGLEFHIISAQPNRIRKMRVEKR